MNIKQASFAAMTPCGECGMLGHPTDYHPYAACLMFKACRDRDQVLANLDAIRAPYFELLYAVGRKYPGEDRHATALRYIQQAEQGTGEKSRAAASQEGAQE